MRTMAMDERIETPTPSARGPSHGHLMELQIPHSCIYTRIELSTVQDCAGNCLRALSQPDQAACNRYRRSQKPS